LFLGATSYRTAAHASAPVAVIPGEAENQEHDGSRGIVVGVDGSRASGRALEWAINEAERRAVDMIVVHGHDSLADPSVVTVTPRHQLERYRQRAHDEAVDLVDKVLQEAEIPSGITVERVVAEGSPAAVLLDQAGPDRLLVVGTRGRGALGRLLFGSVSHQCLHHATGPVLVVP
jgi:nucleotide-binding universal stress UspA family protein